MNFQSDDVLNWLGIVAMLATWFHFIALKPLKVAIQGLERQMEAVARELKESREDRRKSDVIIAEIKKDIEHANDRIDGVEMEVERWIESNKQ